MQKQVDTGGFQMCEGAVPQPLGYSAGSSQWQLEGMAQVGLPEQTGTAEMSFGTIFKA